MPPIRPRYFNLANILRRGAHSTHPPPPPPRPFKPGPPPKPAPKIAPTKIVTSEPLAPGENWFEPEPLDPERGRAASERVVREGILDPRYKPASRRVTAIICALPIFLVTSWMLYEREVLGVEQKVHDVRKVQQLGQGEETGVEVVGEGVGVVGEGGK
jgi:hypothetical protein